MASLMDSSLHTTNSSVDFGTTLEEPFCITSTPLKRSSDESPENSGEFNNVSCIVTPSTTQLFLGPPPPLPTTPKPKTPITKMRIGDMAACLTRRMVESEIRLRSMSFKRQVLEYRLERLQTRTDSVRIRDQRIKRRFTEIRRQRSEMATNSSGSSQDSSTTSEDESRLKRKRFASGDSIISQSESNLGKFCRNRATRKAKFWKGHPNPMFVSAVDLSSLPPKTELLPIVTEGRPKPDQVVQKVRQKVRKTPSFRLKKFIQKKFKVFAS